MSIRNFDAFFTPQSVALIGASQHAGSVGAVITRNMTTGGFKGAIYPVNPRGGTIEGLPVVTDVASLPQTPDLAVICTPPQTIPGLIGELGARGTRAAVVITAGFGELGAEGRALQQSMLEAARPSMLRIIGPNCLGLLVPPIGLNASFAQAHPIKGDFAFLAQSGAMITSVLDWANGRGIGFSTMVSLGGMADADFGDLLDYLAGDPGTAGILLYIEQVTEARKFMSASRRAARLKPVVVIKAGRHEESAKAAASHTGALAGSDRVYDAALRRAGMLRVKTLDELFDAVETLAAHPFVGGDQLAIVTNGGGIGVLATDTLIDLGGHLAPLSAPTMAALDAVLPKTWSHANPVDIIGDAPGSRYAAAMDAVLADPSVDAVLVMNCPTAVADSADAARAVLGSVTRAREGKGRPAAPVLTAWLGDAGARDARALFTEARLPTFQTPDQAVTAFMHLVRHAKAQAALMETPDPAPVIESDARGEGRAVIQRAVAAGHETLSEPEAKLILAAYGIPVVETRIAKTAAAAASVAQQIGFPVAIKILSPQILHKTDVGGVVLSLKNAVEVEVAAQKMLARIAELKPDAHIDGFTVQAMASRPSAHELICGLAEDILFGPVILFGQGGTAVEIVKDQAVALLPINNRLAETLISETRISRLLAGYRDRPAADEAAIVRTLLALGEIAADLPEVAELDINPLLADSKGVLALDARVRLNLKPRPLDERFAIRPYPIALEKVIETRGGTRYLLRPIRPDDECMIQDVVTRCSPDDIRMRFFTAFNALPKALAARLTQIDYDREMAFVAEEGGEAAGIVRLSCDPDFERAEYAVIVRTDRKGTGLGFTLMNEIIAYARSRGVKEVYGDILRENAAMLAMAREFGFTLTTSKGDPGTIEASLSL